MGSTTPLHSLRYPAGGDAPNVPSDMANLASDVDNVLPVTSTSTPTKKPGLVWYNPTTGQTQITDGSTWYLISGDRVPWTSVPTVSGWTSALRARVTADGLCVLDGSIVKASGTINNTSAVQIGSLPSGCQPLSLVRAFLYGFEATTGAAAGVLLEISGGATAMNMTWNQGGNFSAMYFNGISWPVA